jgi:hypothetical protein
MEDNKPNTPPTPSYPPVNSPGDGIPPQNTVPTTVGGMKVIQPLSSSPTTVPPTPPRVQPIASPDASTVPAPPTQPLTTTPPPITPSVAQAAPTNPGVMQPNGNQAPMQSTQAISRSDFEREASEGKRRKLRTILIACLLVVIVGGVGGLLYLYSSQDHSIYANLKTENYAQNGFNLSFSYPAVMTSPLKNPSILVAYGYNINSDSSKRMVEGVGYLPYGNALRTLKITPSEVLSQIVAKSGTFVTALNRNDPGNFNYLYGGCNSFMTAANGQKDVLCTTNKSNFTTANVIGEDGNNQYILTILMPTTIWTAHQKVWQKVEKSFSY